jgi:hypothetical protein
MPLAVTLQEPPSVGEDSPRAQKRHCLNERALKGRGFSRAAPLASVSIVRAVHNAMEVAMLACEVLLFER